MSNIHQTKTSKTTRDMGLFVPSLVLRKLHEETSGVIEDKEIHAGDVIIKMSECTLTLKTTIDIMDHDLTSLENKADRLERLKCIQSITAKLNDIDELFVRLHSGESPTDIANDFTQLTGIQF